MVLESNIRHFYIENPISRKSKKMPKKSLLLAFLIACHALNLLALKLCFPNTGLGFAVYLPISFVIPVCIGLVVNLTGVRTYRKTFIVLALIANVVINVWYFPADTLDESPKEKLRQAFGIC